MSYSFSLFLGSIVKSYIYLSLFPSRLLNKKHKFNTSYYFFIFFFSILIYFLNDKNFVLKTFITIFFEYLIIKKIYATNSVISLIISVMTYSIVFICNQLCLLFFIEQLDLDLIYIKYYPERVIEINLSLLCILAILRGIISPRMFFNEIKEFSFEKKNMRIVFLYAVFSIVFLALVGFILTEEKPFSTNYIVCIILVMNFIVINYLYIFQIKELIRSKNDFDTINNYIAGVEKTASQLKKQEHEHNNELITIKALAQENNTQQIIELIENICKNKNKNKISANIGLDKIHDNILKSLIMHKINSTNSLGLKTEVFIREKINPINVSPKDLTNIIGIIMDNAIEGAINSNQKYISILMDNDEEDEEMNITIANTYKDSPTIYQKGVSTKGSLRGNGLSILSEIEDENDRIRISTEITEELFIQDVFIRK
ncbi:GHKL domain-containing protein [Sedimentibacter sp. zth1]|uniref:sensor histidine kinase n=1 Tax=Sedimentibacter sp. zth1 TaxID=2816908 RepID=UPI001A933E59|nr:GHKL domain-containing protein [Sedimentibacter sp. zth1]QSX05817.1 GHKL domain-containing protein [Sedimentibacter sp. zth1]